MYRALATTLARRLGQGCAMPSPVISLYSHNSAYVALGIRLVSKGYPKIPGIRKRGAARPTRWSDDLPLGTENGG